MVTGAEGEQDAVFYSATATTDIEKRVVGPNDQWQYREVNVSTDFNKTGLDPTKSKGCVFDNQGNPVNVAVAAGVAIANWFTDLFASNQITWDTAPQASFDFGCGEPHMPAPSLDTIRQP